MAQLLANTTIETAKPIIGLISEHFVTNSNSVTISNSLSNIQTMVSVGGMMQAEGIDYVISGNVINFSASYIEDTPIEVRYLYTAE